MARNIDPKDVVQLIADAKKAFSRFDLDTEKGRRDALEAIDKYNLAVLGLHDDVLHQFLDHGYLGNFEEMKKVQTKLKK